MNLKRLKIIVLLLVLVAFGRGALTEGLAFELTEDNMDKHWDKMSLSLNEQEQFNFTGLGLSQQYMAKVLSLQFPKLKKLRLLLPQAKIYATLTPKLVQIIFTSKYFPHLNTLHMQNNNIDNRHLQFINNVSQITSNLTYLNLKNNLISRKGFQSLAKINFQGKLEIVFFNENLLMESDAVSAVMSMLCLFDNGTCITGLRLLSISSSDIQREDFIRLMKTINSTSLQALYMQSLSLIYYKEYNDGMNYTAFQTLTNLSLPNLKQLNIAACFINNEIAALFKNWALPSLQILGLQSNSISDEGLKMWVNVKNMPKLKKLALKSTLIGDDAILHLANEKFKFSHLILGDCKMNIKGFKTLPLLDTSELQYIQLFDLNIHPKEIVSFFKKQKFEKLKTISFGKIEDLKDIFGVMPWDKLPVLQTLQFIECDLQTSYYSLVGLANNKTTVPTIKTMRLQDTSISNQDLFNNIVMILSIVMPNIQMLKIYDSPQKGVRAVLLINLLDQIKYLAPITFQTNLITIKKISSKYQIITALAPTLIFYELNQEKGMSYEDFTKKIPALSAKYEFGTIKWLTFQDRVSLDLIFRIFEQLNIKSLPSLQTLIIGFQVQIDDFLDIIADYSFPRLQMFYIRIIVPNNPQISVSLDKLTKFLKKMTKIKIFDFDFEFLDEDNELNQRKGILDQLYYPFLTMVGAMQQNIQWQEMSLFFKNHNQTIRQINIMNSFSQTGFFSLLSSSGIILKGLDLSFIQFTPKQFANFGLVDTQFLTKLVLKGNNLRDEHIEGMISKKLQVSGEKILMPKLTYLILQENDIKGDGLKKWLSTGIFNLIILILEKNNNPGYLNELLRYPNRINILVADDIEIYGIEENIHKNSVNSVKLVQFFTRSLESIDFQHLGKLDFERLQELHINLYQIYQCEALKNVLKMARKTSKIVLRIFNEKRGLNSKCLKGFELHSRLQYILVLDSYGTTYIPEFISLLFDSANNIKELKLLYVSLPQQVIKKIFEQDLSQTQVFATISSQIGDDLIDTFLNHEFKVLRQLVLSDASLTSKSLQKIIKTPFDKLVLLVLDGNDFSEEIPISFEKLQTSHLMLLGLNRCDLHFSFLNSLTRARLPYLVYLFLNYNNFDASDVFQLISNIERQLMQNLQQVQLNGYEINNTLYDQIKELSSAKSMKLQLDEPRYLPKINHASYN